MKLDARLPERTASFGFPLMQVAVAGRRAHGDVTMGDKSPKSARKQAGQKQIKVDQEARLKQAATTAKQVASKKK